MIAKPISTFWATWNHQEVRKCSRSIMEHFPWILGRGDSAANFVPVLAGYWFFQYPEEGAVIKISDFHLHTGSQIVDFFHFSRWSNPHTTLCTPNFQPRLFLIQSTFTIALKEWRWWWLMRHSFKGVHQLSCFRDRRASAKAKKKRGRESLHEVSF
jgi:hypothetical protein